MSHDEDKFYESFFESCCEDIDLSNACYELFGSSLQQFTKWKMVDDSNDEDVYGNAFDRLWRWDADLLVSDPMLCIKLFEFR